MTEMLCVLPTSTAKSRLLVALASLALFGLLCPGRASGQGAVNTGVLAGEIHDPTGAALPGARVFVTNQDTGWSRETTTDHSGYFLAAQLPTGIYEIRAQFPNFRPAVLRDRRLDVGSVERLRIVLELETAVERAEVRADALAVETSKTEVSQVIPETSLRSLPLNQRSFTALVTQQPGMVQIANATAPNPTSIVFWQGSQISSNGQWGSSVAYLMDGVSINNSGYSAPGTAAGGDIPGVEAIQEFRVLTHDYSAAYGGAAGAVVSFATRGGTNRLHGSLYEYLRNNSLDARGPFDLLDTNGDGRADLPPFRRNQFGATAGGPIRRDRTFFFANYEGLRQRLTTTDIATVPTLAARNGGLGGTSGFPVVGPILQPDGTYRRGPVAIPAAVKPILDLYPLPNGRDFGNGVGQLFFNNPQPIRQDFGLIKIDHHLSDKDLLSARYSMIDADASGYFNLPTYRYPKANRIQNLMLSWNRTLTPSLVNTFTAGFARSVLYAALKLSAPLQPDQYTGNPARRALGVITVGATTVLGASGALSSLGNNTNWLNVPKNSFPASDDLIYARGNHLLKAGGLANRRQENWTRVSIAGGNYIFSSLNDLLAGNPATVQMTQDGANTGYGLRTTQLAWYLEDAWRARSNLTVNLGLRHEFQVPIMAEVNGKLGNVRSPLDAGPTPGTPFNNYSLRQFEPRLGLAYDPFSSQRLVFRAGLGLFHNFMTYDSFFSELFANAPRPQVRFLYGEPLAPDKNIYAPLQFPTCTGCTAPVTSYTFLTGVFNPVHSPTSLQWHAEIEREIARGLTATATYAGSNSYHIPRQVDGNYNLPCRFDQGQPVFDGTCGTAAPQLGRGVTLLGRLFDANASYHALTAALTGRRAALSWSAGYTFAKAISESDTTNSGVIVSGVPSSSQYPADLKLDRSESTFSIRHRVTGNVIYELPFARGRKLLGGWSIAGLSEFRSGVPFSVMAGFGITGVGDTVNNPDRTNILRSNPVVGRVDEWFDPKAYALQNQGYLGNAPRTSVRGPGFDKLDLSLLKNFRLSEASTLEFRAELFNILNHPNYGLPANQLYAGGVPQFDHTPTAAELAALPCRLTAAQAQTTSCNPQAGVISTTVGTPRQIQLGVKWSF